VPTGPTTTSPPITVAPAPAATRIDAAVRLTTATLNRRTGRLTLRGSLDPAAAGSVAITVTGKGLRRTLQAAIRHGRYSARTRLPRRTRATRITVRYGGSTTLRPGRVTRTVVRR
jgi:hypothetical protein